MGRTCGTPFVGGHCGEARVVARPDYGLPEANRGFDRSAIIVRVEDAASSGPEAVPAQQGRRVAVNEWRSFSGHVTLRAYLAGLRGGARDPLFGPFVGEVVMSGWHNESARMVARRGRCGGPRRGGLGVVASA